MSQTDQTTVLDPSATDDRIDDAVLALLLLGLHDEVRAWKSFDWDAMDRLHRKGLIANPASKAKSVALSAKGLQLAKQKFEALFGPSPID